MALASTACYAASAVLQEREAARGTASGTALLRGLIRRPRWWLAVAATVAGAALHIAALALGPLSLVQPLGVLTLVLALPMGARLAGRPVTRGQWKAAAAVAVGVAAVLAVLPHRAPPPHLGIGLILVGAAAVGTAAAILHTLAAHLSGRGAPVARAAAAATCFGFASAMARVTVTAAAPPLVPATLAVLAAAAGLGLAQLAYRTGGLGAPLATQNLVDPVVAVLIGVVLLGEPFQPTPARLALAAVGLLATAAGIRGLGAATTRPPTDPGPAPGPATGYHATPAPAGSPRLDGRDIATDPLRAVAAPTAAGGATGARAVAAPR